MSSNISLNCQAEAPLRHAILRTELSVTDIPAALNTIKCWVRHKRREYVVVCPVYNVMMAYENEAYRQLISEAGMVTPDGMPLVFLLRWLGYEHVERTYGPDLLLAFAADSERSGLSSFFYGGARGVPEKLIAALHLAFPQMSIAGSYSPPFRDLSEQERDDIVAMINQSGADIIWVGLGSPKQDYWMANMRPHLEAPVLIGVGAAFDFLSGEKPQAPEWMQRVALEWLFRLWSEPSRLWRRYLIYNSKFIIRLIVASPNLLRQRHTIRSG